MAYVFTYGTLRPSLSPRAEAYGAKPTGMRATLPAYENLSMRNFSSLYPVLVEDEAHATDIVGEIVEVDEATLARFDDYEGVNGGLYVRTLYDVLVDGLPVEVFVYHAGPAFDYAPTLPLVESGDWATAQSATRVSFPADTTVADTSWYDDAEREAEVAAVQACIAAALDTKRERDAWMRGWWEGFTWGVAVLAAICLLLLQFVPLDLK